MGIKEIQQIIHEAQTNPGPKVTAIGGYSDDNGNYEVRTYDNGMIMIENLNMFPHPPLSNETKESLKRCAAKIKDVIKKSNVRILTFPALVSCLVLFVGCASLDQKTHRTVTIHGKQVHQRWGADGWETL